MLKFLFKPQINKYLNNQYLNNNIKLILNTDMRENKNYHNLLGYVGRFNRHNEKGPNWQHHIDFSKRSIKKDNLNNWEYWNKYSLINANKEYWMKNQILKLQFILSKIFNTNIELEIHKTKHFYLNSSIFPKILTIYNRKKQYWHLTRKFFLTAHMTFFKYFLKYSYIKHLDRGLPYQLTGIKTKLGGRWIHERTKQQYTVQKSQIGSFVATDHNYSTRSIITKKNKKGAYSISIDLGHKNLIHFNKNNIF